MPRINNIIYDAYNLSTWNEELPGLDEKIRSSEHLIQNEKIALSSLNSELHEIIGQISLLQARIALAERTQYLNHHTHHHVHNHHGHHHHYHEHHHHTSFVDLTVDAVTTLNLVTLNNELSQLRATQFNLKRQIKIHEDNISCAEGTIQTAEARINWIKLHFAKGAEFLNKLTYEPADLVKQLADNIYSRFISYTENNPAGLSPQVRFCLLNIHAKLQELRTPIALLNTTYPPLPSNKNEQINYLRLSAFLWEMYDRVKAEGKDEKFRDLLVELLNETHIPQKGDLPDSLQTGREANAHLDEIKYYSRYLGNFDEEALFNYEAQIFNTEFSNLKLRLHRQNPFHTHIENATNLIAAEIATKTQKNELIDYHFYTQAIFDFDKIINGHRDNKLISHLGLLAEHASGAPSLGKQIAGGLLVVAGLLILVASIAGLAMTFGGSSFFSAAGIALGLSLLQFEVAFGALFSVTAVAGSGLTFFGAQTIKGGMQQGLSQEIQIIQDYCENPDLINPTPQYGLSRQV